MDLLAQATTQPIVVDLLPDWLDIALTILTTFATFGLLYVTWRNVKIARQMAESTERIATSNKIMAEGAKQAVEEAKAERLERRLSALRAIIEELRYDVTSIHKIDRELGKIKAPFKTRAFDVHQAVVASFPPEIIKRCNDVYQGMEESNQKLERYLRLPGKDYAPVDRLAETINETIKILEQYRAQLSGGT